MHGGSKLSPSQPTATFRLDRAITVHNEFCGDETSLLAAKAQNTRWAENVVLRREDSGLVCRLRMDVKDPRFFVVDPDDSVRHNLSCLQKHQGTEG